MLTKLLVPLLCTLAFTASITYASEEPRTDSSASAEPPLTSYAKGPLHTFKAFRFSWLRSVDEDLIYTVILQNAEDTPSVTIKRFSKERNAVTITQTLALTPGQVTNLLRAETMSNFWDLPKDAGNAGFDGATWKMEGATAGQTHTTERWSPLPPYYSSVMDEKTHKLIKAPNTRPEDESKSSDEVGLDIFSLQVLFLKPGFDEELY